MAASAIEEPVTPLISVESAIEVCASPPCMRPVSTVASLSRLWVMPELLRKLPARMNSGTASSAKFCVSVTVSWIGMVDRQLRMLQEEQRAGNADREGDRHADEQQHREGDEDDQHGVALTSRRRPGSRACSPRSSPRTFSAVVIRSSSRADRQAHASPRNS